MKQGQAPTTEFRKREPVVHVYNPGGVAQQGIMVIQNPTPLGPERGFMSPSPEAETVHEGGTQGKHK